MLTAKRAKVAACYELLDRAYGRAGRSIVGIVEHRISVAELFRDNRSGALGAEIAARALPAPDDEIEVH
jgi:hypothetical protein